MTEAVAIAVHEAGPDRWDDFETLMGAKGGSGGCWCMLWRLFPTRTPFRFVLHEKHFFSLTLRG